MSPSRSVRIINRLLVEGIDDQEVISQILRCRDFERKEKSSKRDGVTLEKDGVVLELIKKESKGQLFKSLAVEARSTDVCRLAAVVDCDHEGDDAPSESPWSSFTARARAMGYQIPDDQAPSNGAIVLADNLPPLGLWIMPDNSTSGTLEDFVVRLIGTNDEFWPLAQAAVPQQERCRFPVGYRRKAEVHTWLAWQEAPGVKMGSAIHRRYLKPELPAGQAFLDWIARWLNTPVDE